MRSCAILIFARTAAQESYYKQLSHRAGDDVPAYEYLNKRIVSLAVKSGLPYFIYNEDNQKGANFGTRLGNAVADVFKSGFDQVVILGNDCPEMKSEHLQSAAAQLQNSNLVLGPDLSGGAYLIGISREIFDKEVFSTLQWQTKHLLADLKNIATAGLLPTLADIKNNSTIQIIIERLSFGAAIRNLLLGLLQTFKRVTFPVSAAHKSDYAIGCATMRGPPASL